MPDLITSRNNSNAQVRWVDNGDGTFSEVVATRPAVASGAAQVAQSVVQSTHNRINHYHATAVFTALTAAADAANAGKGFFFNTSSTIKAAVRKLYFASVSSTGAVAAAATAFTIERCTFTGTPSSSVVTAALADTSLPAPVATIRIDASGVVVTSVAVAHTFLPHSQLSGASMGASAEQRFPDDANQDNLIILRQNEGLIFRQAGAGAASDNRAIRLDISWEEWTT